ncbi:MAG: hypothetical protein ABH843_03995 [Candidatus Omnitrophota bacterium]
MFNLKDLGDMSKIASEAKQMQKQQEIKHEEQITLLKQISGTLNEILAELKKDK